jgi:hypothetical protein
MQTPPLLDRVSQSHVARQDDDGNAAPRDCGLYGNFENSGHLVGLRHQFAIVAALREEMFRVGLLEVSAANFIARDLRRDGEDRNPAAVTVVESVNQVQISGTAAPGANRQPSGEMRIRARGEGRRFFMPQMNPIQLFGCSNRVGNAIERVAGDTVNPPDPRFRQNIH